MPAHHPGRRARRIDEDPVIAHLTPFRVLRLCRVGRLKVRLHTATAKILRDPLQALGVDVERGDLQPIDALQDVQRLFRRAPHRRRGHAAPAAGPDRLAASCAPAS